MIYLKLFWVFFKIGAFTFGGGYAMLPLVQQEVLQNGWLSNEEIVDFIAISESTPGPFAVNMSTLAGMQTAGIFGAFCATFGVVLPSFIIILLVARIYDRFQSSKVIKGAMLGLKGAVVGLIGAAVISTAISVFGSAVKSINTKEMVTATILLAALGLGIRKKIHPIILIIVSAIVGMVVQGI
ncbi:MAG: chromate transporter [Lachnospiraceae bacterium]|nr:chromate transporter [Lachnospiraceae bacterium]